MDQSERNKYKQLANDAIIATYGYDNRESQLAEALEKCLDELRHLDQSPHCPTCSCGLSSSMTIERLV